MAVVEDDQAGAHGSCSSREPAHLDLLDDDCEAQPVIEGVGDPALMFRDVAEVYASIIICDRTRISRMVKLTQEFEGVARLDKPIDVAPAVHTNWRRTPEFSDTTWIGAHARLSNQGKRIGAALPLAILFRHKPRVDHESVYGGQQDQWPCEQRAADSVKVPRCDVPLPETGDQGW
jgi:hypothetical protein